MTASSNHQELEGSSERLLTTRSQDKSGGQRSSAATSPILYHSLPVTTYGSITGTLPVSKGDVHVDMPPPRTMKSRSAPIGMSKSELMKYVSDPFWMRLRSFLYFLFWFAWFGMAVGAILVVMTAPRCAPLSTLAWWQKATVYQIYLNSFMDSNGDGQGDINGLMMKLEYFEQLGVDTLLLSRIHRLPYPATAAEDLDLYMEVDEILGTIEEFETFLQKANKQHLKVVMDLEFDASNIQPVVRTNHSIVQTKTDKENFYLPNLMMFKLADDDDALTHDVKKIKQKLMDILSFWLDKGIAGFRVVIAGNNPLFPQTTMPPKAGQEHNGDKEEHLENSDCIQLLIDKDQPNSLLSIWKELIKENSNQTGIGRVLLIGKCGNIVFPDSYTSVPSNFDLLQLTRNATVRNLFKALASNADSGSWPNWVLGDYSSPRLATRVGLELLDGIHMAVLLARGTPIIFYGDEIGMEDIALIASKNDLQWRPVSPMQWSDHQMAGFTEGNKSWIPLNENYKDINVEVELTDKNSHLNVFRSLIQLREATTIKCGIQTHPVISETVFSMMRLQKGQIGYLVVLNWGNTTAEIDFRGSSKYLPSTAEVEVYSGSKSTTSATFAPKTKVSLEPLILGPTESVVLSFAPPVLPP